MSARSRPVSRAFFSANPVFRREEYARAVGRPSSDPTVSQMLDQHLRAGNIKRIARAVFASVPAHAEADAWPVDHLLAASRLRADATIAYHSALELHGFAYTLAADVQAISKGEPGVVHAADFVCRFVTRPKGFVLKRDCTTIDRLGLPVRVTTIERTIADLFDRLDLAGGGEELLNSLALIPRLRFEPLFAAARANRNAGAAGALGWWLEKDRKRLGIGEKDIARLKGLAPKNPQYVLGAKPGEATSIGAWNILTPRALGRRAYWGE